jgi:hypothetical protein
MSLLLTTSARTAAPTVNGAGPSRILLEGAVMGDAMRD